ncbi:hypothetical protein A2U01_0094486, partial [Trifolium medium]|nr:hypothetical protein [Trifolium medium]
VTCVTRRVVVLGLVGFLLAAPRTGSSCAARRA